MAYRVAIDDVPKGRSLATVPWPRRGWKPRGQNGIPTAFIVNKEGKIAWIGHPMEMEKPLDEGDRRHMGLKTAAEESRKRKKAGEVAEARREAPVGPAVGRSQEGHRGDR